MNKKRIVQSLIGLALGIGLQSQAAATRIEVQVENLTPAGGVYFTPLWVGFHDGSFDSFDVGASASMSLEMLAEGGDASGLSGDIGGVAGARDGVVLAPNGFAGAPVFDPMDSGSLRIRLDSTDNRYFSFASMIIPSNDAFFANDDPTAYELFDATGAFNGPLEILVLSSDVLDAGTEVNDGLGAPFTTLMGMSTDEMASIGTHPGLGIALINAQTAAGTSVDAGFANFASGYQLARITINAVPEPHVLAMLGLGIAGLFASRRRGPGLLART